MTEAYALHGTIDFTVTSISDARTLGEMPVQPGILNPFGTVHAGALIWFADVIATRHVFGDGEVEAGMASFPVAVTLNAQLLSNRNDGVLMGEATWVKKGRRVSTVRTLVSGPDGKVLLDLTSTHVSAR
ncbi:PaaI family thioesterase [Albimonas sp. CAU 1670]|uniref:PaaI family thioesterase n=1 Tax=Albimonas sp. CAU 1670 TaxID=3032599 RepID=UPI0023DC2D61|nr:PaaI family thioesterase [Albimonas sp. CAU 1670]MDF2231021.1 PaaI family thioesterase [Albimonas sp. CAU 1670]